MTVCRPSRLGALARERGSLTVELVLLAPVLVLFALLATGLGRYQGARQEVVDAANAGAEAASLVPAPVQADAVARSTAEAALKAQAHMCPNPVVTTDTSQFVGVTGRGGWVRVSVDCRVGLADLLVAGFPGSMDVTVTQTAPVDPYRVVG
jgi:Flp pilus assembly protein TadG